MELIQVVVSMVSGGLAGGCVSTVSTRMLHFRSLRTQFEPKLSDIFAAYAIRLEKIEDRVLITKPGFDPLPIDKNFVDHRATFITDLAQFNELREARTLRKWFVENPGIQNGIEVRINLVPELQAISDSTDIVHKKLKLS